MAFKLGSEIFKMQRIVHNYYYPNLSHQNQQLLGPTSFLPIQIQKYAHNEISSHIKKMLLAMKIAYILMCIHPNYHLQI